MQNYVAVGSANGASELAAAASSTAALASQKFNTELSLLFKEKHSIQNSVIVGSATAAGELAAAASWTAALASQQFNTELSFLFRTRTVNAE